MSDDPLRVYDLDLDELESYLTHLDEPSYRAQQVWEWLYVQLADSFEQMTNLPGALRERLAEETTVQLLEVVGTIRSTDGGTRKDLLRLLDGETIEAVLMRYERRRTACLSTQVGCGMGCPFCATGQMGFRRDLSSGEIVAQAVHFTRVLRHEGDSLTNVVLMGMGEPLANYEASLAAIRRLSHPTGFRLGQRHITLSTVGLVPEIHRLAREELQITLAVSLHAATDDLRNQIVPINRRYPLDPLFDACADYVEQTGRRISFEWALITGVNDGSEQAHALANRIQGLLAHVNLIPLNPSPDYQREGSNRIHVRAFAAVLDQLGVPYTIRVRRGTAIQAGCGQLRQRSGRG